MSTKERVRIDWKVVEEFNVSKEEIKDILTAPGLGVVNLESIGRWRDMQPIFERNAKARRRAQARAAKEGVSTESILFEELAKIEEEESH